MLSIVNLPPPPPPGKITSYESDGLLKSLERNISDNVVRQMLGERYIYITVSQESVRPVGFYGKIDAKDAFSAYTETPWQRVVAAFYEEGWESAIKELSISGEHYQGVMATLCSVAAAIAKCLTGLHFIKSLVFQKQQIVLSRSISESSKCSFVSFICWHTLASSIAVVFHDDTIRIFTAGKSLIPLLKHRFQKSICDIAWMPYSASVLAVGCDSGIILWTVDPVAAVFRPSSSCVSILKHNLINPIKSITWHPKGLLLACSGGRKSAIIVWDISFETPLLVHFGFTGFFHYLKWSPDGHRLLAAASANYINCKSSRVISQAKLKFERVFETYNWTSEKWALQSPLKSGVWSKTGNILLFATEEDSIIYCIYFTPGNSVGGSQVAIEVADLAFTEISDEDGTMTNVGGRVEQLAWDPRSERLAVVFRDSELIVIFHTYTTPQLHLAPGGFIRGLPGTTPVMIGFQQNLPSGAVLSVVWSNGDVQHIPMHFASCEEPISHENGPLQNSSLVFNETLIKTFAENEPSLHSSSHILASPGSLMYNLFSSP